MATPASGTISFYNVWYEYVNGGCYSTGGSETPSNVSMQMLAVAQNPFYSSGTISMSGFYNSVCPKSSLGGGK
jgi:hypothetical protein